MSERWALADTRRRQPRCVVGIDGTDADAAALRTASLEAHHRRALMQLVGSFPSAKAQPGSPTAVAAQKAEQLAAARHLERLRGVAAAALPGLPVTAELTTGPLARALVTASRTAAVVVLRCAPNGAVAQQVARHAWCPVLLDRSRGSFTAHDGHGLGSIPGAVADDTGGVVVGVGDAASAADLLTVAIDEAARRGTGLLVVHARPTRTPVRAALRHPAAGTGVRSAVDQDGAAERLLADAVEQLRRGALHGSDGVPAGRGRGGQRSGRVVQRSRPAGGRPSPPQRPAAPRDHGGRRPGDEPGPGRARVQPAVRPARLRGDRPGLPAGGPDSTAGAHAGRVTVIGCDVRPMRRSLCR